VERLQECIGYYFGDERLLENALTHSSFAHERKQPQRCNERLEFLGDSVLSIVVADYLYHHYPELPEGELTRIRAASVCEKALYGFAKSINLGDSLLLSRGEQNTGGRNRPSILADAFEALIAAIYLDGGMEPAKAFILKYVVPTLDNHRKAAFKDYKTLLQEVIQQNPEDRLTYLLVEESGPDHDKVFKYEVHINSNPVGTGTGRSKKEAEQAAAKEALRLMGIDHGQKG
jgi:ribonuclease-3